MTKAEIKLIKSLSNKQDRVVTGLFVAEGEKLISELIESDLAIGKIFALEGLFEGDNVEVVSKKDLERVSFLKSANNSIALVRIPRWRLSYEDLKDKLVLALDDVQNPGNIGTIIRIADWFGIEDIVCSEASADCFNPKVIQATMGAILRVRIHYVDMPTFLGRMSADGVPIYGTFLEGENIYNAKLSRGGVIVMGNEGRGVSPQSAACVGNKLLIPPFPVGREGSESLNVAVATSIVCSEFRRRTF